MKEEQLVPDAQILLESLRAVGYSFETAIADLIDNSITAHSFQVRIRFSPYESAFVALLDDGIGMSPDELREAMRHGSSSPTRERKEDDLGRFGLGLKTASLSQARRLTVVSMKNGVVSGRCWDLDVIEERKDWSLLKLEAEDIASCPLVDGLRAQGHGTLILWEKLDRILAGESSLERALGDRMDTTRDHLALVFHRYLTGRPGSKALSITINEAPVEAQDPFLRSHPATQLMPEEEIVVAGSSVRVTPYILPHISKLKPGEIALAGGHEGLRRYQGFYVYRSRRLINWGTWFKLARQEELTKLARVQVDIPNTLDHLWTLDIKKSVASPPEAVRELLRRIVGRIGEGSRRVYTYRGTKSSGRKVEHLWDRVEKREGEVTYLANRRHHLFEELRGSVSDDGQVILERYLKALEVGLPKDALYADMAGERNVVCPVAEAELEDYLSDLAAAILESAGREKAEASRLLERLPLMEPFDQYKELTQRIIKGLTNG